MDAEIQAVVVPGLTREYQIFCVLKSYGKIVCTVCKVTVKKGDYGKHFSSKHSDMFSGARNEHFRTINTSCEDALIDTAHYVVPSDQWCRMLHSPLPHLERKSGFLCVVCRDQDPVTYHVALDRKQLGRHYSAQHPTNVPDLSCRVDFQSLAGNNNDRLALKSSDTPEEPIIPPSPVTQQTLSARQIQNIANPPVPTNEPQVPQNFRELALVEEVMQTRKCLVEEECVVVRWILDRQNPVFGSKEMKREMRYAICEFLQLIVKKGKSEPPPQFLQVIAEFCERDEFTFISTESKNYQTIYWLLIVWVTFIFFGQSSAQEDQNLLSVLWTEDERTRYAQMAAMIPAKWKVGIDHQPVRDAVWELFSAIKKNASMEEPNNVCHDTTNETAELPGINEDVFDPDVARDPQSERPEKYFTLISKVFLLLFARTAVSGTATTYTYDALYTFLVAVYIGKNNKRISKSVITSFIAGLEYALRAVILLEASRQYSDTTVVSLDTDISGEIRDLNMSFSETYSNIAEYIKTWTHPSPSKNNVANLLSHTKMRIRKRAADDRHSNMQINSSDGKLEFVFQDTQSVVDFKHLKEILLATLSNFRRRVNSLLPENLKSVQTLVTKDPWNNNEVGYSLLVANDLKDAWIELFGRERFTELYFSARSRTEFLKEMDVLHEECMILSHTTAGGPTRSTSMAAMRMENSPDINRSLIWFQSNLILMTQFEKNRNVKQKETMSLKTIARVMQEPALRYWIVLRPVEAILRAVEEKEKVLLSGGTEDASQMAFFWKKKECSEYVFLTKGCRIDWDGQQIRDGFCKFWKSHGINIRFNDWRHLFETLLKHVLETGSNVAPTIKDLLDIQMGHTVQTGRSIYGLTADDPGKNALVFDNNITAARTWQKLLLGGDPLLGSLTVATVAANINDTGSIVSQVSSQITIESNPVHHTTNYFSLHQKQFSVYDPCDFANRRRLSRIVEAVTNNPIYPNKMFHNDFIQQAFQTMIGSSKDYILVIGTGLGKSTIYHYLARDPARTNDIALVFVATRTALVDQVRSATVKNLPVLHFSKSVRETEFPTIRERFKIIFAQIEDTYNSTFVSLVKDLANNNRLGTMILDEAHLAISHQQIRGDTFDNLLSLFRGYPTVQKFFLTATVPWYCVDDLRLMFGSPCSADGTKLPEIIYQPSTPKGVSFHVRCAATELSAQEVVKSFIDGWEKHEPRKRMMIFVQSKLDTIKLRNQYAQLLPDTKIAIDHGDMTIEAKRANLEHWQNGKLPVMIATSGMGQAVDCSNVNLVIVLGCTFDAMTFLQMAGRNRGIGNCVFVTWTNRLRMLKSQINSRFSAIDQSYHRDLKALYSFLTCTNRCRRSTISESVYKKAEHCLPGIHGSCDICIVTRGPGPSEHIPVYLDPRLNKQYERQHMMDAVGTDDGASSNTETLDWTLPESTLGAPARDLCRKPPSPNPYKPITAVVSQTQLRDRVIPEKRPSPTLLGTQIEGRHSASIRSPPIVNPYKQRKVSLTSRESAVPMVHDTSKTGFVGNNVGTMEGQHSASVGSTPIGNPYKQRKVSLTPSETPAPAAHQTRNTGNIANDSRTIEGQQSASIVSASIVNPYKQRKNSVTPRERAVPVIHERSHTGNVGNYVQDRNTSVISRVLQSFQKEKKVCAKCLCYRGERVSHLGRDKCREPPVFRCFRCHQGLHDKKNHDCGVPRISMLLYNIGVGNSTCYTCLLKRDDHSKFGGIGGIHGNTCPFFDTDVIFDWCMFAYQKPALLDCLLVRANMHNIPRETPRSFAGWIVKREGPFQETNGLRLFVANNDLVS